MERDTQATKDDEVLEREALEKELMELGESDRGEGIDDAQTVPRPLEGE
ncbi:MAG: hypothetical protein AB1673_09000 [Actinomycetota bacterium]|jgi:hypothetical protein